MRSQRGQAIVLIALMLTVIIGMAAIAIDGSRAYALRRDLQGAVDAAALAAGDNLQQTGNWSSAERAAANIFAANLRVYAGPTCGPFGAPGASAFTVTCNYLPDSAVFTLVAQGMGPQGSQFTVSGQRNLQLQFARILTNGTSPTIASTSTGGVNNLRYTPALGALDRAGCGSAGSAVSISGSGTLNVTGDLVANGAVSVTSGAMQVAGDIWARCQSPVPGAVTTCYPSGLPTPCAYPDVAGATRSGFYLVDPNFPAPRVTGSGQPSPSGHVVLNPGVYSSLPILTGAHCWFLSGGVYDFQLGAQNVGDVMSNELKPPGEPNVSFNNVLAVPQFWNTNGANCAGSYDLTPKGGPKVVDIGTWSFLLTSVRTDNYNGVNYQRESAPSVCQQIAVTNAFNHVVVAVSNVPGATSYNIYAAPPSNGCAGPFGLVTNLPVTADVQNSNTSPCPVFTGGGCSLGNESIELSSQLSAPFAPNALASPGTAGAYPPASETAPLALGLPNQNPPAAAGAAGDRANENNCETIGGAYATCPNTITPGAVELYFPAGACFVSGNGGDTFVFSGAQYNWVSVYEPPGSGCTNTFGAASNSAYMGLVYTPAARDLVTSAFAFEGPGSGGMIADSFSFSGSLPAIMYNASYAPAAPATRITN